MKPEEIKTRLRDEMADLAPDRLEDLLAACLERIAAEVETPGAGRRWPDAGALIDAVGPRIVLVASLALPLAAAAVFVLLIGGIFGYRALDRSVCTVIVDINPSVTLTVNRLGRVKAMDTGNADAAALRDGQAAVQRLAGLNIPMHLVVNRVKPRLLRKLRLNVDDAMDQTGLPLLGVIPEDRKVPVANAKGELLVTQQSRGAARGYENIAQRLCGKRVPIGWK